MLSLHKGPPRFSLVMTRNDDHVQSAVPTQKLEWVTPKISLMETGETLGNNKYNNGCAEGVALMGGQCNVPWPTAGGPS